MLLRLLGPPRWDGGDLLPVLRPAQLLCLLACAGQWLEREQLAEWLWPERGPDAALGNLRTALARAQVLAAGVPVQRQARHLRWLPATDLQRLEQQLDAGDAAAVADAPALLLQGMEAGLSAAALEWLGFRREQLRVRWQGAARQRLRAPTIDAAERIALARRLLAIDALDEAAVLVLADGLRAQGDGAAATAELRRYAQRLLADHGLEPSVAVAQRLAGVGGTAAGPGSPGPAAGPGAAAPTAPGFIGRRRELGLFAAWVAAPQGRLLTVVGPGGIGKSRLARAAAPSAAAWVALEGFDRSDDVPAAMARALDAELSPAHPPWLGLALLLGPRPAWLVLDSAEHLADLPGRLDALLGNCPGLRLIVTSQHRLGLADEQLLPLEPLPLPDRDETDIDVLARNDAFALVVERARRLAPGFDPGAQAGALVDLVHAADGVPLALVLAAGWVRALPLAQIAGRLTGGGEDAMQASLRRSWQLLALEDRHTLALLAALPQPLDADMAQHVAFAALPKLAALVDRSMLAVDDDGRFTMHALTRQYALASPEAGRIDRAALSARHAARVGHTLARHADFTSGDPRPALAALSAMAAHFEPAWRHAVALHDLDFIARHALTLSAFFDHRGHTREALLLFDEAVTAAGDAAPASLLLARGNMAIRAARLQDAEASARRAARRARLERQPRTMVRALLLIVLAVGGRGEAGETAAMLQHALRVARQHDMAFEIGLVQAAQARLAKGAGNYAEAEALFNAALEQAARGARPNVEGVVLQTNNLANLWAAQGQWARALPMFERALQAAREGGIGVHLPLLHGNLARAHAALGEPARALADASRAHEAALQRGRPLVMLHALLTMARAHLALHDAAAAEARLVEALALADMLGLPAERARCVVVHGRLLAARGTAVDVAGAAALWRWARDQPSLPDDDRREIDALLAGVPASAVPWQPAARPLDEAVAAVLQAAAASRARPDGD